MAHCRWLFAVALLGTTADAASILAPPAAADPAVRPFVRIRASVA